jgi:hypothetical protein
MKSILAILVGASFLIGLAGSVSAEPYGEKRRYQESRNERNLGNHRKFYGYRAWKKFTKPSSDRRGARRSHNDRDGR